MQDTAAAAALFFFSVPIAAAPAMLLRVPLALLFIAAMAAAYSCTCNKNDECTNIPSNGMSAER